MNRATKGLLLVLGATTMIAGCTYREPVTVPAATTVPGTTYPYYPASSPATTIVVPPAATTPQQRVIYAEGAYELHGTGTVGSPYYWVWVPRGVAGTVLPPPPPLPPLR